MQAMSKWPCESETRLRVIEDLVAGQEIVGRQKMALDKKIPSHRQPSRGCQKSIGG